jgi:hypothetical protein
MPEQEKKPNPIGSGPVIKRGGERPTEKRVANPVKTGKTKKVQR